VEFNIGNFYENLLSNFRLGYSHRKMWFTSCTDLSIFILVTAVQNILWLDEGAKGTHYCVFVAKLNGF